MDGRDVMLKSHTVNMNGGASMEAGNSLISSHGDSICELTQQRRSKSQLNRKMKLFAPGAG